MRELIVKHWNGQYSLARSYWVHLVLGSVIVVVAAWLWFNLVRAAPSSVFDCLVWPVVPLTACWQAWAMKGVWSAASRDHDNPYAGLAKLMLIVHATASVVTLGMGCSV